MGILSTLLWPTLISAAPLGAIGGLLHLRTVRRSAGRTALVTLVSGLLGCVSTALSVLLCATSLAEGMPGQGSRCVSGAAVFFLLGVACTCAALCRGLCQTFSRVVAQRQRAQTAAPGS